MAGHRFASVSSVDDDGRVAASEAVVELRRQLGGPPDWVIACFSSELSPAAVVDGIYDQLDPATPLCGCSSSAEIDSSEALSRSVALLGARRSGLRVTPLALTPDGRTSQELGRALGQQLQPLAPSLVILFPDVLTVNATELLRGIQQVLGAQAPIIGGAAADDGQFVKTYQICGRTIQSSGVVALAINGPLQLATAARSGYTPVSIPRLANRVEDGKLLLELDGRPALAVYREFLGERANQMPAVSIEFPLGIFASAAPDSELLLARAIFAVDAARGGLILGGSIPQGAYVRILSASASDVLAGAKAATTLAQQALPDADLALLFNCISRKVVLGASYRDEVAGAFALLPPTLPKFGFYTFGELSPVAGQTEHHESTFTLALLKLGAAVAG